MRDWRAYVRDQLTVDDLSPEREARVVREVATQLEDFFNDARARGLDDEAADAFARSQVPDWRRMARDVLGANGAHLRPRLDRLADRYAPARPTSPGGQLLMHLISDVRYSVRQLIKNPGFAIIASLTLALGVGATTSIFSVVNGVLLRPLPYDSPDELVRVHEQLPQLGRFSVAPATFVDWREQNSAFERLAAYSSTSATFTDGDVPERISGADVSWDAFELLGVGPVAGTGFASLHGETGAPDVIVISHGMWQARFGGDEGAIGRSVPLDGRPTTIVGVMPRGFYFPSREAEFWSPLVIGPDATRGAHFLGVLGRLKDGVTVEEAGVEIRGISERLALQYPADSADESAEVVPLLEQVVGSIRPALLTLFAAVGVVALIACANVANLLLVRASVREKEVAIRAALGASRRRLATQMLAESVVLAAIGGSLGLLLAWLAMAPIRSLGAGSIPRVADVGIDASVLLFTAAAAVITGMLFGLAPAWHAVRGSVGPSLKDSGRSSTGARSRWVRNGLLIGEVALSIILLVGAVLLLRSFARITNVDPGFDSKGVLAFQVSLPQASYGEASLLNGFHDRLHQELEALPGVSSAGIVQTLPLRGGYVLTFAIEGRPDARPGEEPSANYRTASPAYFEAVGIPLMRGRLLEAQDNATSERVALIDDAFVTKHFPDEDPIGRALEIGNGVDGFWRIVGVVGSVRHGGLDSDASPTMYVPYAQYRFSTMWVVVSTDGDPTRLAGSVRGVVQSIDATLPAYSITPLSTVIRESVAERRFSMLLLVVFAGVALAMAAIGLYGVVAYTVSQRTREIGLRMAIGAQPGDVLRMVIGDGMKLAAVGVAIGLLGAAALAQVVESMLFEVSVSDPMSYAATAAVLLTVCGIACWAPARRAMRVDPLEAMQTE